MSFESKERYSICADVKSIKPEDNADADFIKELSHNYQTLPVFEKSLYDHNRMRYYSLQRNEKLACRWSEYKKSAEGKVFIPFQFPDRREVHFYMQNIRFVPSQSLHNMASFKRQLKPGPGVDQKGQTPIPQELLMKRDGNTKEDNKKHQTKNKKVLLRPKSKAK